jgi:hypothetical protein
MSLKALQAAMALQQKIKETCYSGSFRWAGIIYPAAITRGPASQVAMADGSGFRLVQMLTISVKKTCLTTAPPDGGILTINAQSWRVDGVDGYDSGDLNWRITATQFSQSS